MSDTQISDIEDATQKLGLVATASKSLSFSDLAYSVRITNEEGQSVDKEIVKSVSGEVEGGKMLCLLGPSGSGKTSLVSMISGRITTTASGSHKVDGTVLIDGQALNNTEFRKMSGLVTQDDVFNGYLTVYETLYYSAALTLPADMRDSRIEYAISALQLDSCRNTFVGDDADPYTKGISGGEKRRLAIAMEILDPTISFLMADEPTSGLDAAAAQNVANLLRTLANQGMTVLATLHQPRNTIMARFDRIMVLAKGRSIFYGTIQEYKPYLVNDLQAAIPEHENPYDLLLDALNPVISKESSVNFGKLNSVKMEDGVDAADILADLFDTSTLGKNLEKVKESNLASVGNTSVTLDAPFDLMRWAETTYVILERTFLIKLRDPICLATQLSSGVIMGLIFGALYFDCYNKSTVTYSVLDTQMCIVMGVLMAVWLPYDVTLTFPKERTIFLRERKAGLYKTSAFYIARIVADMPTHIISAAIMAIIIWGMAGLKIGLGAFILIMVYGILVGAAVMQLIGAMSRTFEEANIYMMIVLMMSMMLGTGFVREVPSWLEWARDISIMGICADLGMYLEFKDVNSKYGSAEQIFREYGVQITNDYQFWNGVLVLFYIYIFCRVLCYLFVKFLFTGRSFEEDMRD
jgi:ABC-type multidrug transport system ATPase subunit